MSIGTVISCSAPRSGASTAQPPGAGDPLTATAFAGALAALTALTAPDGRGAPAAEQGAAEQGASPAGQGGREPAGGSPPGPVVDVDSDSDSDSDISRPAVPATAQAAVPVAVVTQVAVPATGAPAAQAPAAQAPVDGDRASDNSLEPAAPARSGGTASGDVQGGERVTEALPLVSRPGVGPAGEVHGEPAATAPPGRGAETSAPTSSEPDSEPGAGPAAAGQPPPPATAGGAATRPPVAARALPTPPPVPPSGLGLHVAALKGDDGDHVLRLSLHPLELGAVRVDVRVDGDQVTVSVLAASDAAVDAVRLALPELRAQLEIAGLLVTDLEVGPDRGEDEETAGQQTASGEASDGRPDDPDPDRAVPGVAGTEAPATTAPTDQPPAERAPAGQSRRSIDVRL